MRPVGVGEPEDECEVEDEVPVELPGVEDGKGVELTSPGRVSEGGGGILVSGSGSGGVSPGAQVVVYKVWVSHDVVGTVVNSVTK